MRATLPAILPQTLVIYDLDNTLIRPTQTLGSDQWFRDLFDRAKASGATEKEANRAAVGPWVKVQKATAVATVEAESPAIVSELQKSGHFVMGLTARPDSLADTTFKQLKSVGYRLDAHPPVREDLDVLNSQGAVAAHFSRGVIFVGPAGDKGQVLVEFLRKTGLDPQSIVFVDDRSGNTESVSRALSGAPYPHTEFRYGAADAWVKSYDSALAQRQWEHFEKTGRLLRDEETTH